VSLLHSSPLSGRLKQACAVSCSSSSVILSNHTPPPATAPKQTLQKNHKRSPPEGSLLRFDRCAVTVCVCVCVPCSRRSFGIAVRRSLNNHIPYTERVRVRSVIMVSRTTAMDDQQVLTYPQQAMTPLTPLEPGVEMFERGKTQSFFSNALTVRSSLERPLSHISVAYTDIEDDSSEFEEFGGSSVCILFYMAAC
jgi:hypothetical protein